MDVEGRTVQAYYDPLDKHLAPCVTNRRVDQIAENMWEEFLPEALSDPKKRKAENLAAKMGLSVMYHPVYEHRGVRSIVFFREGTLSLGVDRRKADTKETKKNVLQKSGKPVIIPANTIVIILANLRVFQVTHWRDAGKALV